MRPAATLCSPPTKATSGVTATSCTRCSASASFIPPANGQISWFSARTAPPSTRALSLCWPDNASEARQPGSGAYDQAPLSPNDGVQMEQSQRSEEHTSELQSRPHLVCRLLLVKINT